jgi:hypothetical protein
MELMESKTGYKTPASKDYEAMVERIQRWPSALVHELAALDRENIGSFILKAMAQPMTR